MVLRGAARAARLAVLGTFGLLLVAAVVIVGTGAGAETGAVGPVEVSVLPAVGLTDGQVVSVSVRSIDTGVVIYSVTAHLCATDKVTGDRSFSFAGTACTNVPVGQSDTERALVTGGTSTADLQFTVGTGRASWLSSTGYDGQITCGQGSPCDLVLRIEVTDGTLYYKAPLCFGTGCRKDPDAPPPAVPTTSTPTPSPTNAADEVSSPGGRKVPGSSAAAGGTGGGSARSDDGASGGPQASGGRLQSRVSGDDPGPTVWRLRIAAAALVGAIGGIRISALVKQFLGRRAGAGVTP